MLHFWKNLSKKISRYRFFFLAIYYSNNLEILICNPTVLPTQVLYLVDPIDEVAIQNLQSYKENKFVDISKEDLDLGKYFFTCDL